ncbi:hypothetical protein HPB48_009449 [Haemaphysalis longicornis]|uniref:Nuclear pore complex protein Nup98-Nup96 n=1 Tax=Haemaphysalis longicornis TaxID=44386 RepID=A0A9J6GGC8_HAELO|nr:hypothetical protein HPB48_009449 [Haemaphysalis longicornis]
MICVLLAACGAFVGTTVKYQPSFWIDSTATNGVLSLVYVAHQCITCMKEYEHKSLELRLEDYSANRKYGSKMAAGVFNTASQSASSIFSPFAPTLRPSLLFGATENGVTASPFGTSATPGDGDLGDKLEPNSAAPEQPSSRNTASPGTLCAICLGPLQDKSGTDSCSHAFCYTCLLEWAKVKQRCPVCKERFFKIIVQGGPSQE